MLRLGLQKGELLASVRQLQAQQTPQAQQQSQQQAQQQLQRLSTGSSGAAAGQGPASPLVSSGPEVPALPPGLGLAPRDAPAMDLQQHHHHHHHYQQQQPDGSSAQLSAPEAAPRGLLEGASLAAADSLLEELRLLDVDAPSPGGRPAAAGQPLLPFGSLGLEPAGLSQAEQAQRAQQAPDLAGDEAELGPPSSEQGELAGVALGLQDRSSSLDDLLAGGLL